MADTVGNARRSTKKEARRLQPQTPNDCELCRLGVHKLKPRIFCRVTPWPEVKNASGRKKESNSEGRACPRRCCVYYGITDMRLHALRIFPFHHTTFSRWLARAGKHGRELHEVTFRDFICAHLQLDELMTRVKKNSERVWLWTAVAAKSKVLLVMHVGGRKKQDAQTFIHLVKERLATEFLPVFTSDGLRMYFYALTAHYGIWYRPVGARKDHWQVDKNLLYGQFRKVRNGFRIANIYTLVQWGERQAIK